MSIVKALMEGKPVVFAKQGKAPEQIVYTKGTEKETISLLLEFLNQEQLEKLLGTLSYQHNIKLVTVKKQDAPTKTRKNRKTA